MTADLRAMRDDLATERELCRARITGEPDPDIRQLWSIMAAHRRIERDYLHTILRAREIQQHADQDGAYVLHFPPQLRTG